MSDTPLMGLNIVPESTVPLFAQVYQALRSRVTLGLLATGDRLPPTRKLAEELGVSRTTIITAYNQLIDEGFAHSKIGSGVYVSEIGHVEQLVELKPNEVPDQLRSKTTVKLLPFHPGQADDRLFPYQQWARCISRVARTCPEALVKGNDLFGDLELRYEICRYLADWRGVRSTPAQVLITAGAGNSLELCIRTLITRGSKIALENPGYPQLRHFTESLGIPHDNLKMDKKGALPPTSVHDGTDPKLLVLTPSSQFPLGGAMPQLRRNEFIEWALHSQGWIIEDDYDSEFRYAGRPIPALAGLDPYQRTLYIGSFSKVFSNGLRIGFVVLPTGLVPVFSHALQRYGSNASIVPQRPLAQFMGSGEYYRHIRRVRRIYAERRSTLIELLGSYLGDLATFEDHRAGMQIAVHLPAHFQDVELAALARQNGVMCSALSSYYASTPLQHGLLMGFCSFTPEEMTDAMGRLKTTIDAYSTQTSTH